MNVGAVGVERVMSWSQCSLLSTGHSAKDAVGCEWEITTLCLLVCPLKPHSSYAKELKSGSETVAVLYLENSCDVRGEYHVRAIPHPLYAPPADQLWWTKPTVVELQLHKVTTGQYIHLLTVMSCNINWAISPKLMQWLVARYITSCQDWTNVVLIKPCTVVASKLFTY